MENYLIFTSDDFGDIRTSVIDGEPYFVARDVAEALGYANYRDAIRRHVDIEDRGVVKRDTLGGTQDLLTINESGLYSLILSSKLPNAKKFKRWVTSEVIPSIRKNGGYISGQEQLTDEQLLAKALMVAQNKILERDKKIIELEQHNEEMRPKAIFADAVTASDSSILMRELAKILKQNGVNIGEKRLYKWMRERGYIIKHTTQPTQRAMELGLFEVIERSIQRSDLPPIVSATTKVTGRGQQYFINKFLGA